ncbi:glycosyltransferase family 4 protein [Deinococcus peraridilitoris]|uniref:Glycosyltransferase n=1 Tax=Deinococcus peraridilitoris (strain DSM 19664 / LMG 22246 / CIP 109416 / KR-200) TaxID=937777 RepID=L0A4W8_DEIPD|nr:glycosyltransferase family 4 protein [Deinococcus peraridilitoris]AFZ68479.1 glycosyltransferase [Deinococcus peraridilitoris DSM 19664]
MRIGIVTATYLPSKNGVATSTALFARGLRALGHEVRIFAPDHPQRGREEADIFRLPSTMVAAPADYPLLLPPSASVIGRLPLRDLDVIHTMHPFLAGQVALRWARSLGVPLFFTAHTQYHQYVHYTRMSRRLGRWLIRRHVRAFAGASDVVLAPGGAMVDMLRRYGYQGDVDLLPNPIDPSSFREATGHEVRAWHGIPAQAPLLIYVGRLAPEKNLPTLLAAFKEALEQIPGAHLLLVGAGLQRAHLQNLAAGWPVHFAGAVEHARVPQYLSAANAFITASTSEVLPMSMIEALAAGLPLVAARSPAAEDLVIQGENGFLCEASPAALANGIARVFQADALPALHTGALSSARAFDMTARAGQLADLYALAIAGRAAHQAA